MLESQRYRRSMARPFDGVAEFLWSDHPNRSGPRQARWSRYHGRHYRPETAHRSGSQGSSTAADRFGFAFTRAYGPLGLGHTSRFARKTAGCNRSRYNLFARRHSLERPKTSEVGRDGSNFDRSWRCRGSGFPSASLGRALEDGSLSRLQRLRDRARRKEDHFWRRYRVDRIFPLIARPGTV